MLLFQPKFRNPNRSIKPENPSEAEALGPGVTPLYPTLDDLIVNVQTPEGTSIAIDDPALLQLLSEGLRERHQLRLMRSERALTDCRPLSLFSLQTAEQLGDELGTPLDKRRFRANLYLDLGSSEASPRIGSSAIPSASATR